MRRLPVILPRLVVLALAGIAGTATLTYAAAQTLTPSVAASAAQAPAKPVALVVPDVRNQAYVFAKGSLEDAGFAWRLVGGARGYAANTVASQSPAPGTRVVDTGSPLVTLRLVNNGRYPEHGTPEQAAPFRATALALADTAGTPPTVVPATPPAKPSAPKAAPELAPAASKPVSKATVPKAKPAPSRAAKPKPVQRPPAFAAPGAHKEPLGEPPLSVRARALDAWLAGRAKTPANVRRFLYQNSWVVTGAKFGWWHGAEALRLLIRADEHAQRAWGLGAKSEAVARAALAEVEARS